MPVISSKPRSGPFEARAAARASAYPPPRHAPLEPKKKNPPMRMAIQLKKKVTAAAAPAAKRSAFSRYKAIALKDSHRASFPRIANPQIANGIYKFR